MSIKPLDIEPEEEEYPGLNQSHTVKTVFLIAVIFLGSFFWWHTSINKDEIEKRMARAGVGPSPAVLGSSTFNVKERPSFEIQPDEILSQLQNESSKLLDSSMNQASKQGENALEGATTQVTKTATESVKGITTAIYTNTIGKVVLQLLDSLPKDAQKKIIRDAVENLTPTPTPWDLDEEEEDEEISADDEESTSDEDEPASTDSSSE